MWTGRSGLQLFCRLPLSFLKPCVNGVLTVCASALLLMVAGCSWDSSTQELPTLPTLTSLQKAELDGVEGVWMDNDDAGRLSVWIYDVTGNDGL